MNTPTLTVVVLVVYMGAMLFIGWLGRNTSENFEEYITAAKKGSLLVVCGSYLGSHIGNGVVVGGAQNGRRLVRSRRVPELHRFRDRYRKEALPCKLSDAL